MEREKTEQTRVSGNSLQKLTKVSQGFIIMLFALRIRKPKTLNLQMFCFITKKQKTRQSQLFKTDHY